MSLIKIFLFTPSRFDLVKRVKKEENGDLDDPVDSKNRCQAYKKTSNTPKKESVCPKISVSIGFSCFLLF